MHLNDVRSLLFVPATSESLWAKAAERGADAIIIDLEDGVSVALKDQARVMARRAIEALADVIPVLVRVNAPRDMFALDIDALPLSRLHGVLLPKVESPQDVQALAACIDRHHASDFPGLPIAALIETPLGVMQAQSIATAHPSVAALGFGAEDYATDMGVPAEPQSLLWAAQAVTCCARAYRLACWGLPGSIAQINDMTAFASLVRLARNTGFSGTACIHPRQVPVANAGFGPSDDELAWARSVVAADDEARSRGLAVVTLDGRMIDRPVVERARNWLRVENQ